MRLNKRSIWGTVDSGIDGFLLLSGGLHIRQSLFFCKWRARDWLAMMMKKSTTVAVLGNTAMFGNGYRTRCRKGQSLEWKGFYSCSLHSKEMSKWQQHRPNFAGFSCIETTYHGGEMFSRLDSSPSSFAPIQISAFLAHSAHNEQQQSGGQVPIENGHPSEQQEMSTTTTVEYHFPSAQVHPTAQTQTPPRD